ncbi:TIGR02452 family protein [Clostridia bacterium]|nr:TIGR02452 family protein [Clostridia bacterium]
MSNRERNIQVFRDTQEYIAAKLQQQTEKSVSETRVYKENFKTQREIPQDKPIIKVIQTGTTEAAEEPAKRYGRVAILNFASAKNPGGGVENGSSAQEEAICRVSNLFNCLKYSDNAKRDFYNYRSDLMYTNRVVYSPDVQIFKRDDGSFLTTPFSVDVLTCAAPNLRYGLPTEQEYRKLLGNRMAQLFNAAAENNAEAFVLGAWGCGVFGNPPEIVADEFRKTIENDGLGNYFKEIVFAVYAANERDRKNVLAFKRAFEKF